MESAPRRIDVDAIRDTLLSVPGVASVHDLHVWTITSGMDSLSAHLVADEDRPPALLLVEIRQRLASQFAVHHVTIQIEPADFQQHATCASPGGRCLSSGAEAAAGRAFGTVES
jgi:cobalt-zinc-cadmium efflux system protein